MRKYTVKLPMCVCMKMRILLVKINRFWAGTLNTSLKLARQGSLYSKISLLSCRIKSLCQILFPIVKKNALNKWTRPDLLWKLVAEPHRIGGFPPHTHFSHLLLWAHVVRVREHHSPSPLFTCTRFDGSALWTTKRLHTKAQSALFFYIIWIVWVN